MSVPGAAEPHPGVVPPIRHAVTVRGDREHVYDAFVREIGTWWPTRTLSLGATLAREVRVEPRLGGRVYEVWHDGGEYDWGEIVVWEPPERFAMTWEATALTARSGVLSAIEGGAVTEVEIRFVDLGPSLTMVEQEHRGWERLSAEFRCACPPGYQAGWSMLLERFAAHVARR
ncbi:SRPBCC domain-containing protein [Spongiactinospora sp. TRM90649]|uniref:SRPBCC domain-containing protein n=1 Tax=Spongiactinospora sp. TRM90649 TaxID=3031114 RepID=UPI0023F6E460|nr:SRPBCC domain-containing protein [Spongiactinospora sp. TRM90649]MDF5755490.1 SRPBCC domain-containing protein [Spongiactinospora sp. TRM90649]